MAVVRTTCGTDARCVAALEEAARAQAAVLNPWGAAFLATAAGRRGAARAGAAEVDAKTVRLVWPFPMAPGCREAAVVRAWLQSGDKDGRVEIFAAPSTAGVAAPHGTAVRNQSEEGPWDRVHRGDARVVVKPLRLRALLAGTPLARWAEYADLWKVLSGADFPWQAELAARLAVGYKYGGHVAPFDFLKAPRRPASGGWPHAAYVYHNAHANAHPNISASVAWWEGGLGPFLLPAGHQLLSDWMVVVATSLERCADALRASSITETKPCVISTPLFAGALQDASPVPANASGVFHSNSEPRRTVALVALDAAAVWADVLKPNTTKTVDALLKTDAYAGAWLAQRFLGQTALPPGSAIAAILSAAIGGGSGAVTACLAAGAPWHTGCALYTRPSKPPAAPTTSSFGVLAVPVSYNVGDDIQGMGSLRFLPFLGHFVDRDDWAAIKAAPSAGAAAAPLDKPGPGSIATIMNGWYRTISATVPEQTPLAPHFVALHLYKPFVNERNSSFEITRGLGPYVWSTNGRGSRFAKQSGTRSLFGIIRARSARKENCG